MITNKVKNCDINETKKASETDKLEFQICDWNSYHEIDGDEEEKYVIQLFGRTEDDKDVCLKVTGFTPFFYVEVPLNWTKKGWVHLKVKNLYPVACTSYSYHPKSTSIS